MEKLKDIMSPDVQVISPDATIRQAAQKMREGDFGMMPVAENDRMIGALSDRDIAIRATAEGKGPDTQVRDVISEGIAWAYEDDSVDHRSQPGQESGRPRQQHSPARGESKRSSS